MQMPGVKPAADVLLKSSNQDFFGIASFNICNRTALGSVKGLKVLIFG
jgi:hypothetical protein